MDHSDHMDLHKVNATKLELIKKGDTRFIQVHLDKVPGDVLGRMETLNPIYIYGKGVIKATKNGYQLIQGDDPDAGMIKLKFRKASDTIYEAEVRPDYLQLLGGKATIVIFVESKSYDIPHYNPIIDRWFYKVRYLTTRHAVISYDHFHDFGNIQCLTDQRAKKYFKDLENQKKRKGRK